MRGVALAVVAAMLLLKLGTVWVVARGAPPGSDTANEMVDSWLAAMLARVPDGPVRFDNVVLAEDRRSLRVDFIGSQEFDPDNPCSNAYEGAAEIVGHELEIGIYALQHPKPLARASTRASS